MKSSTRRGLSRARAVGALSRREWGLSTLASASRALASTGNLTELLDTLSRALLESVECTVCKISLFEDNDKTLAIRAARARRDLSLNPRINYTSPLDELPIHQWVAVTGQPMVLIQANAATQLREPERSLLFDPPLQAVLLIPLAVKTKCLGVAVLGERRRWDRAPFSRQKIELARALGQLAALAILNLRMLESIAQQNEEMRSLSHNVADGILLADGDGCIQFANPAAERLLGYTIDEMLGRKCPEITHAENDTGQSSCGSGCPLHNVRQFRWETPLVEFKEVVVRHDGTSALVNHRMAPIRNAYGEPGGVVSLIRDVSAEERALRLKSEFVSMVAHELRAPLANMMASTQVLSDSGLDPSTSKSMIDMLNQECHRLSRMVNHVLESARLENGQLDLSLEPIAMVPLIEQTIHAFQSRNAECKIAVVAPDRQVLALGDSAWVQLILENLIQNAIDYSESGGKITVAVIDQGERVGVSVEDEGRGIPHDELGNVFRKFFRGQSSNRRVPGFGLGLYNSKMLVEALGGAIDVESKVGRGSRFHFTLRAFSDDRQDPRD